MKCITCGSISLSIICKSCMNYLLVTNLNKRVIGKKQINYSFYTFSELEELINSKYHFYGDEIYKILAKQSFKKFAKDFSFDEEVIVLPIDDHTRHSFSHTAILAKAMKTKILKPKYNCLKAKNIIKYAGKDLEFRQKNPRDFQVNNIKNKKIILVDDLITTGSTILEATKVLEKQNNEVLFSLTLADAKF